MESELDLSFKQCLTQREKIFVFANILQCILGMIKNVGCNVDI